MPVLFDGGNGFVIGHTAATVDIVFGPVFGPYEDILVYRRNNGAVRKMPVRLPPQP